MVSEAVAPETIRFRVGALWKLFVPVGVLAIVSVAVDPAGWRQGPAWVVWTFGAVLLFLLAAPVLMRRYYFLRLSPDGLTVRRLLREQRFPWPAVESIHLAERSAGDFARAPVVVLRLRKEDRAALRRAMRGVIGGDVSILSSFEKPPEEIVALLETWRRRYGTPE